MNILEVAIQGAVLIDLLVIAVVGLAVASRIAGGSIPRSVRRQIRRETTEEAVVHDERSQAGTIEV